MLLTVRMLAAWFVALLCSGVLGTVLFSGGKVRDPVGGLLGIGLVVGIPMLVFAVVIALPLSFFMASIRPPWLAGICAATVFASIAGLLSIGIFPDGWKGAAQAMVLFAALLGVSWGTLGYVIADSGLLR
jgi:ABC-type dipeptide/oligopeptide/nickel transport system permease component